MAVADDQGFSGDKIVHNRLQLDGSICTTGQLASLVRLKLEVHRSAAIDSFSGTPVVSTWLDSINTINGFSVPGSAIF